MTVKLTQGALKAAREVMNWSADKPKDLRGGENVALEQLAEIIDRETGCTEMLEALQETLYGLRPCERPAYCSRDSRLGSTCYSCHTLNKVEAAIAKAKGG